MRRPRRRRSAPATGDRLTRDDINKRTEAARAACAELAREAGLERLRGEIEDIDRTRKEHTFWRDLDSAGGASLAQHTRALETVSRIEWLQEWGLSLAGAVKPATTRADLARLSDRLLHLEAAIATARREIVTMGPDGYWDALVEIAPVGAAASARDFIFRLYQDWAKDRQVEVVMLREPMAADEPIAVALRGHFAHGYLKGEAGHHRVRQREQERGRARHGRAAVAARRSGRVRRAAPAQDDRATRRQGALARVGARRQTRAAERALAQRESRIDARHRRKLAARAAADRRARAPLRPRWISGARLSRGRGLHPQGHPQPQAVPRSPLHAPRQGRGERQRPKARCAASSATPRLPA